MKYHAAIDSIPVVAAGQRQFLIQPSNNVILGDQGNFAYVYNTNTYRGSVCRLGITEACTSAQHGQEREGRAFLIPVSLGFPIEYITDKEQILNEVGEKENARTFYQRQLMAVIQKGAGVVSRGYNYRASKAVKEYKKEIKLHGWLKEAFPDFKASFLLQGYCSSLTDGCRSGVRIFISGNQVQYTDCRYYRNVVVELIEYTIQENNGRKQAITPLSAASLHSCSLHSKVVGRVDSKTKAELVSSLNAPGAGTQGPRDISSGGTGLASPASQQHRSTCPETNVSISQGKHAKEAQRALGASNTAGLGIEGLTATQNQLIAYSLNSKWIVWAQFERDRLPSLETVASHAILKKDRKLITSHTYFEKQRQNNNTPTYRPKLQILDLTTFDTLIMTPASLCAGFMAGLERGICFGDHYKSKAFNRQGSNHEVGFILSTSYPHSKVPATLIMLTFTQGQDAKSLIPAFRELNNAYHDLQRENKTKEEAFPFKGYQTDCDIALGNAWMEVFSCVKSVRVRSRMTL